MRGFGPRNFGDVVVQFVRFFEEHPEWMAGMLSTADGRIRSVRHNVQTPVVAEMGDNIGLTVQISEKNKTQRRIGSHVYSETAAFGRAFLDRPGDRIEVTNSGECRLLQMRLPKDAFDHILAEDHDETRGLDAIRPLLGEFDHELMRRLARALLTRSACGDFAVREIVARLVEHYGVRRSPARSRGLSPVRLRRVRDLVAADLAGVTASVMAQEAGLSLFHFTREFRRETGQTPWEYVVQCRVWAATRLLCATGEPIDDIARQIGFAHASHMGRSFRKLLGVSPSAVRAELLP